MDVIQVFPNFLTKERIPLMNKTFVPATLASCLVKFEDFLGPNRRWESVNVDQGTFITLFDVLRDQLSSFSPEELENAISWDHEELNKFLEDRGFPGKFEPFDSDTFGAAAVLKVQVEWLARGEQTRISYEGNEYSAFSISEGVRILSAPCHDQPIARVETKSGDVVYLTVHDRIGGFELDRRIREIEQNATPAWGSELIAPCVNLEDEPDLSYLIDMGTVSDKVRAGQRVRVSQAFQINRLKMNHLGAKVESGAGMAVSFECVAPPPLMIDKPFIIWFRRPGVDTPILEAYVDAGDWSDPGDLNG